MGDSELCAMDNSDSRKRPLDGDSESGVSKRSNQGVGDNVHLKILVPSIAAGAIIGKGGETITQIQKDTGANIKMSKANDFYPGTTERVCLITGNCESVRKVHNFIMERIRDKPDPNPKPIDGELKVKVLVPNSTAGMIIGKAGNYIRQIKEESGAYVQISQKSKDMSLPERCVTVAGDLDQNRRAVDMILQKIVEDPQSGSCPNISYQDVKGPVASSNPTGSPFAQNPGGLEGMAAQPGQGGAGGGGGGTPGQAGSGIYSNIGSGLNNLNLNASGSGAGNNPALENLKATLRGSGYSEHATEEISAAMYTLANYGFLGLGLGLAGLGIGVGAGLGGLGNINNQGGAGQGGNLTLASLAGILGGTAGNVNNAAGGLLANNTNAGGGDANPSVFGPVGSTTTTMAGGDTGENSSYFATTSGMPGEGFTGGDSMFANSYTNSAGNFSGGSSFGEANQNSFGLGTGMGGLPMASSGSADGSEEGNSKKEVEVGEHIVGAILGPGGKGIVELQKFTGANIQISKKGVYAPGTRNRIVTMTGSAPSVQRAQFLIQQRIQQEETKRARQGQNGRH